MSLLTFAKTALGSMVKQPVTVCYPQEKLAAPERLRGHIVNDMDVCICCGMCARRCPAGALAVDRKGGTWSIDRPGAALAIDRQRTRRAATRAHAATNAHVHIVDDMSAQALGCRELFLRIAHRYRLFDHGTQGRLGKCQQTHAVPTFPCS